MAHRGYTGTYKYNPKTGKVEKVSDKTTTGDVFDCFVPDGGYYSDNLGCYIESRAHKRRVMKEQGVREIQ